MKKNFRGMRVLCIMIALILVLQIGLPVSGFGGFNVYAETDGSFKFNIVNGSAEIYDYTGVGGVVTIPATVVSNSKTYNVTRIGGWAFQFTNITSITIPSSVTSIGDSAFYGCSSLTSIMIPSSMTNIERRAFYGCWNLNDISVASGNTVYSTLDGVLYNQSKTTLIICPEGKIGEFPIPSSVTSIKDHAFTGCINLTSITVPSSVTSIGGWAFNECSSLKSIAISPGVTIIGQAAFYGCSSLTNIAIPSTVTTIVDFAFNNCSSLSSITIPSSVTSIGEYTFYGCSSALAFYFMGNAPLLGGNVFLGVPSSAKVYYINGNTGFTNPWYGRPTQIFDGRCNITFNSQEGSAVESVTTDYDNTTIEPAAPTRPNYTFGGWYKESSCVNAWDFDADKVAAVDTTLYAKWSINQHNVTFNSQGGSDVASISADYNTKIDAPTAPIRTGYTFVGWHKEQDCINNWEFSSDIVIEDITLYAMWTTDFEFEIVDGTAQITGYVGEGGAVTIPATVTAGSYTYNVTSIGAMAFYGCSNITSITIPNSVTSIVEHTFYGCSSVTRIIIPSSVTSIEDRAFYGCSSLTDITVNSENTKYSSIDGVLYNQSATTLILYPVGKNGAFSIPSSVTSIGNLSFYECENLTSVTIPSSVISIGDEAFDGCSSLTSITIPSSVTSIGYHALVGCSSLTDITVVSGNTKYSSLGGVLYNQSETILILYPMSKNGAFSIPSSVTSIGDDAFSGCNSLTSITIPSSVTSIGDYAFYRCSSITSVTIPSSVTSIGDEAFVSCSSLASIAIPSSVTSIGIAAFGNCSSLTSITIPSSVTSIGESAFVSCSSLTSITIPSSVTSIGAYAFSECSSLTSITIPSSVTSIGDMAFYGCTSVDGSYFLGNAPLLGESVFSNCADTFKVYYIGGNTGFTNPWYGYPTASFRPFDFNIVDGTAEITGYTGEGGAVTIPSTVILDSTTYRVTSIGGNAFQYCSKLTSITIPAGVTSIGNFAFEYCSNLTSITIPSSVASIEDGAFKECTGLTDITIPYGVTSIKSVTFQGCSNLTSVTIPSSVTSIGAGAFSNCSGLASITIPSSVTNIVSGAFGSCSSLASITIPSSVTIIESNTFSGCTGLTSVTIPSSVTSIGVGAFLGCGSLASITIPSSVTSIGKWAFQGSSLTSIIIPSSVTSIAEKAFNACGALQSAYFLGDAPTLGLSVFQDCPDSFKVFYNKGSVGFTYPSFPYRTYLMSNTITFNSQGGSLVESVDTNYGTTITAPTAPTRTGYTFAGWYVDASCKYAWDFATYTVTSATTLYAKWTINQYTVTYNTDGGINNVMNPATYTIATGTISLGTPTKIGHTFAGWYNNSGLTGQSITTIPTGGTGDITLYAKWTINQYAVTFDSQGGSSVDSTSTDYETKIIAPTAPTMTGYPFGGWYKESSCINAWDFATDKVTAATTLYAKWTPSTYTIDNTAKYISAIGVNTDVSGFKTGFASGSIRVYDGATEVTSGKMKTGMTIQAYDQDGKLLTVYTAVVTGDVNGDGNVSISDLVQINRHLLGLQTLTGAVLKASDLNNSTTVNISDLVKINKVLLGLDAITPY